MRAEACRRLIENARFSIKGSDGFGLLRKVERTLGGKLPFQSRRLEPRYAKKGRCRMASALSLHFTEARPRRLRRLQIDCAGFATLVVLEIVGQSLLFFE